VDAATGKWRSKYGETETSPEASYSTGQIHGATGGGGQPYLTDRFID